MKNGQILFSKDLFFAQDSESEVKKIDNMHFRPRKSIFSYENFAATTGLLFGGYPGKIPSRGARVDSFL